MIPSSATPTPAPAGDAPLDTGALPPELAPAVLAQVADAVVVADAAGHVTWMNESARRLHGVDRTGVPLDEWASAFGLLHLDGTPFPPAELPLARALRGEECVTDALWMIARPGGSRIVVQGTATPLRSPAGEPMGAMLVARDVTAERERERLIVALDAERGRLEELARAAEAANRAKTAFLATMSHELRTPLNAILGYTELMEMSLVGPVSAGQRSYHERVRISAQHLLGLINEVLDLAKVEAGQMSVAHERVGVTAVVNAALVLVRPQAAARALEIPDRADCPADLLAVGDEDRVRQVLANLLSNAVKFTPERGRVSVRCGRAAERDVEAPWSVPTGSVAPGGTLPWVWVCVEDTGVGIPRDRLEAIFEPFVQLHEEPDAPYRRTQGGTGLGLAISRELARLMGGDITAKSRVGEGSAFTLWLPALLPGGARAATPLDPMAAVAPRDALPAPRIHHRVRVAIGEVLGAAADAIARTWSDRLVADPAVPRAREVTGAEREDHVASFLSDFAQQFSILDEPGGDRTPLVEDGVEIRHLIARRHGRQRARLGWQEPELVRELILLRDEIERALREQLAGLELSEAEDALSLTRALLYSAAQATLSGFREERDRHAAAARGDGRGG